MKDKQISTYVKLPKAKKVQKKCDVVKRRPRKKKNRNIVQFPVRKNTNDRQQLGLKGELIASSAASQNSS